MYGAFGNPQISTSPAMDGNVYASQADLYNNSFSNPMNYANQNQGWSMNSNLMSPSYTSPYRPPYSGPNPTNSYGRTGFMRGAWNLMPMSPEPRWGNPFDFQRNSIEDVTGRPADAAAWAGQRIAMPMVGFGVSSWASSQLGLGWGAGSRLGAGMGGGMASAFGMNAPRVGGQAMGLRSLWSTIQGGYAEGAASGGVARGISGGWEAFRGIGLTAGGAGNLAARGLMGAGLGAAAYIAAPLLIGQAVTEGMDRSIFQPYINTRRTARSLRDNFSGITFGENVGNSVTGRGLGYEASYRMAGQITRAGIQDMSFSTGEYTQGADMIARSGLLDNTGAGGLTKKIKDSMEQVKMIMRIANMPEFKDAIEQLAKLNQAGASVNGGLLSTAAKAMGSLGSYASMGGTSVSHLMNTVGAQGQYLYQANGLTPYLGQLAAAGAYSSLASGQRMGLISEAAMARMGGLEGATQSSLTGQLNMSQTLFNKMALYNQFKGGTGYGAGSSTVGIVNSFASRTAQDPLGTYGDMMLHSHELISRQMKERGSLAIEDQLMPIANMTHQLGANGKLSAERAYALLAQGGMSDDEIQAYLHQVASESDTGSYKQRAKALNAQDIEQSRAYISQNGIYGGTFGNAIYQTRKAGRAITSTIGGYVTDAVTSTLGRGGDSLQEVVDSAWYGPTTSEGHQLSVSDMLNNTDTVAGANGKSDIFDTKAQYDKLMSGRGAPLSKSDRDLQQKYGIEMNKSIESVNDAITNGTGARHDAAVALMSNKDSNQRMKLLTNFLQTDGSLGERFLGNDNLDKFQGLQKEMDQFAKTSYDPSKDTGMSVAAGVGFVASNALKFMSGGIIDIGGDSQDTSGKDDYYSKLTRMSGRVTDKADQADNEVLAGEAVQLAGKYNTGNIEDALSKGDDKQLMDYYKKNGSEDPATLLRRISSASRASVKEGGAEFDVAFSNLDPTKYKTDKERYSAALEITGGKRWNNPLKNADKLSDDEVNGYLAQQTQFAEDKAKNYNLYKNHMIDTSTYMKNSESIESRKSMEDMKKATQDNIQALKDNTDALTGKTQPASEKHWWQKDDKDNQSKVNNK